ncbi:unnamed protein product [Clonostachys byssicola]|uniref:mitogen-activated protein kinase n=1 Tax=Clonostachys byssicola TaxID=160290 RepID=A0A9N9U608_9HYPO|nr:unnamed protein product [Clonostachys byssicola]
MASGHQGSSFRLLFSLVPDDNMNEKRSSHQANFDSAFKIGLDQSRKGRTTLATIGRDVNCDFVISDPAVSRLQCSFEINPANGLISLIDRSRLGTTDVGGEKSIGFPRTAQRQVVVLPGFNDKLFLCGKQGYRYFIQWKMDAAMQSRAMSRLCTPGAEPQEMTWQAIETIKTNKCGTVSRAANGFTGGLIAVKKIDATKLGRSRTSLLQLEKNVESLRNISHDHIVSIITSTGWCDNTLEIAMELKDGSLQSLVDSWVDRKMRPSAIHALGLKALYHSLLGLKWLHDRKFAHGSIARDGNPNSIHNFDFVLADFGLSTADPKDEYNRIFLAPERHYSDRKASRKSDIWSLYVTMLMVLQVDDDFAFNIRSYDMDIGQHFDNVVQAARSTTGSLQNLHVMARKNPEERWSANEVLEHFFKHGHWLDRPLPPPDLLPRDRRQYGPSSYKAPRRGLTRQSTMERLKQTGDNILRRITGEISDAAGRRGMTFRGHD